MNIHSNAITNLMNNNKPRGPKTLSARQHCLRYNVANVITHSDKFNHIVAHLPKGELGGLGILVDEGGVFICLCLQPVRVGHLHRTPWNDHQSVRVSLVYYFRVDLV